MNIDFLRVSNLRCFEQAEFRPHSGINWLVGANGTGKTTLLEAAYILSHGRSFRAGGRHGPRRQGASEYLVHAEVSRAHGGTRRLGITRGEEGWHARLDGRELATLAPLFAACPVVCFGPESAALILGPAEERRSFLDWSVFHVEHDSLSLWRRWRRALRQRNALLRANGPDGSFPPWEHELGQLGASINRMRRECLASLAPFLADEAARLVPELGLARLRYRAGWDEGGDLEGQLAISRQADRERGFTQVGAHRADWGLHFEGVARRDHLSRGQAKSAALVCLLAQARWLDSQLGEYPLVCVDDVGSELDAAHVGQVITWLRERPVQAWLASTAIPRCADAAKAGAVFHVEHGGIAEVRPQAPDPL